MDYINKVVSKLYAVVNHENKVVAEVIENPGMGFDYLIRIDEKYKTALPIFAKCMFLCNVYEDIDYNFVNASYERQYILGHENVALMVDKYV